MIDIKLFRAGEGAVPDRVPIELVLESQRRRFAPCEDVHEVAALDDAWRKSKRSRPISSPPLPSPLLRVP
jgi:hypothetical protein